MIPFHSRLLAAAFGAAVLVCSTQGASAQSGPARSPEQRPSGDAAKDRQELDELIEAARVLSGPAGQAECVWLGRRVVGLLWRDDLDTATRHLELYDRFGCPAAHIKAAFRCVLGQNPPDPKAPEGLKSRVHACWLKSAPPAAEPSASRKR